VEDNGIGIAAEDLERIFEPFYTKKMMGRSGTGLGMAVIWGTVTDHRGYIHIDSKEGFGTRIAIYFPAIRDAVALEGRFVPLEEYVGKGEAILVVDDVVEQRELAGHMLAKLGYLVHTAAGGEAALQFLAGQVVDLVILDMIMDPGIDGLETYMRILKIHPEQRTIIVSGFSETDRVLEAQRLGARSYVKKPYTLEKLGIAVRRALTA
jgi:two-component system, cell cycle sensor histidine kinase and response regulator CckA